MVMGVTFEDTKSKIVPSKAKKPKDMRQGQRLSLVENVTYNVLWSQSSDKSHYDQRIGKGAQTRNFSEGGIGLLTPEALKRSEILQLKLFFSEFGVTIPMIAEVVWTGRKSAGGLYRIGLRYLL
jgi:hypothetical protein